MEQDLLQKESGFTPSTSSVAFGCKGATKIVQTQYNKKSVTLADIHYEFAATVA